MMNSMYDVSDESVVA